MKLQPDDGLRYSLGIKPSSDDAVRSRQKFARRFAEGIGKFAGNAKGDRREEDRRTCRKIAGGLTMIGAMELQPDDGPRSSLGIRPGSDDEVRPCRKFTRRFVEGIGKLAWNTPGDHRKKTRRLCRKLSDWREGMANPLRERHHEDKQAKKNALRTKIGMVEFELRLNVRNQT
ncbi:hypothetical protein B296_00008702 [Ensete ventricosum]|uniref:Uncharacterized protein n=1 Tax=Ensete ventricosum TaxID=4639 RepID=A0A426X4V1_ENSVE|nr:hypothetical protein B296_00008702 [Ensete ventricosum]